MIGIWGYNKGNFTSWKSAAEYFDIQLVRMSEDFLLEQCQRYNPDYIFMTGNVRTSNQVDIISKNFSCKIIDSNKIKYPICSDAIPGNVVNDYICDVAFLTNTTLVNTIYRTNKDVRCYFNGPNIYNLGALNNEELPNLYTSAKKVIIPNDKYMCADIIKSGGLPLCVINNKLRRYKEINQDTIISYEDAIREILLCVK